jgi:altronate dehydratase small subunit
MTETKSDCDAIQLHPEDNVATALRAFKKGEMAHVKQAEQTVVQALTEDISLCHKLAVMDIPAGAHIKKYGEVIGEAVIDIAAGAHVHVHNIKSLRARVAAREGEVLQ